MNVLDLLGDSHCHLDVTCTKNDIRELAERLNTSQFEGRHDFFHIMTTNHLDLELMDELLEQLDGGVVVPYWGVHPWYSHLFCDELKLPLSFSTAEEAMKDPSTDSLTNQDESTTAKGDSRNGKEKNLEIPSLNDLNDVIATLNEVRLKGTLKDSSSTSATASRNIDTPASDETSPEPSLAPRTRSLLEELKYTHYNSVLTPPPTPQLLAVLPQPIDIHSHLNRIRSLIKKYPQLKYGIGEIGLDRMFRIPLNGYFGNQIQPMENQKLSYSRVSMDHQQHIFKLHLALAEELERPVSLHCVKAHGSLYNIVTEYPKIPRIILHSYSGSLEQAKMWMGFYSKSSQRLYFSLSNLINGVDKKATLLRDIVTGLESEQLLIETDVSVDKYLCGKELRDVTSGRVVKEQATKEAMEAKESATTKENGDSTSNNTQEVPTETQPTSIFPPPRREKDYFHNLLEIYRKICVIRGWDLEVEHWRIRGNLRESIK
jgi:Tat protein secretion system quality control protein TatD with DNase activity